MTAATPAATSRRAPLAVAVVALACLALAWLVVRREAALDARRDELAATLAAPPETVTDEVMATERAPPEPVVQAPAIAGPAASMPDERPMPAAPAQVPASVAIAAAMPPLPAKVAQARAPVRVAVANVDQQIAVQAPDVAAVEAPPVVAVEATTADIPDTADPLQLLREANAAIDRLTAYLASSDGDQPPFYSDLTVQAAAAGIRLELQQRIDDGRHRIELDAPGWRLGTQHAELNGAYRVAGRRGVHETGWMHVGLVRHERRWLVSQLRMEPAQ